jgi:hypothetical protein
MKFAKSILAYAVISALVGCASMTVTKITPENTATAAGIRYSLPKPFIQAVPQSDGTIAVDVVYLPDSNNTYAIDTSSEMSSYVFQVALDQNGLLNAVEYKQSTSAVSQQVVASTGSAAAQIYNIKAAQSVAAQTAVNSAQSNVDAARAALAAAQNQLDADTANKVETTEINKDRAALAVAQAKYQDALQVLDRVRNTAQAVSVTATAATPIVTTPPTPGTTGFSPQNWSPPIVYDLPEKYGAVLFAINEGSKENKPYVELKAAKIDNKTVQYEFDTTAHALGPPVIKTPYLTFSATQGPALFIFNRDVKEIKYGISMISVKPPVNIAQGDAKAVLKDDKRTVELTIDKLKPGQYKMYLQFVYDKDSIGTAEASFSLVN